jgi:hypothetical protein
MDQRSYENKERGRRVAHHEADNAAFYLLKPRSSSVISAIKIDILFFWQRAKLGI